MAPTHLPANMSAGRAVTSGADGTYMIVQGGYSRGRKHQWGPELARNGLQAALRSPRGGEQVVFDFQPLEIVDAKGNKIRGDVWKRRVWNNAAPMTAIELMDYFSSLAKGGGTNRFSINNLAGQYGQGSRFAVLPHSNMLIATTEPGGGTDAVLIYDSGHGTYNLANFVFPNRGTDEDLADMREDCYLDLGSDRYLWMMEDDLIHPTVIRDGGVTTFLLGPDIFDHYVEGDPSRKETSRTLVDDLTKWLNFPIPVEVWDIRKTSKGGARVKNRVTMNGQVLFQEPRTLKTYDDWIARVPVGSQAVVDLHNPDGGITEVEVYLLPKDWNWIGPLSAADQKKYKGRTFVPDPADPKKVYTLSTDKDAWFPWDGKGCVVIAYDYEMIPMYDTGNRVQHLKNWYVNDPGVGERTMIIIRPPQLQAVGSAAWGVQQTGDRGTLLGPNSSALPDNDWTDEFYDLLQNSPDLDFMRKALEEAKPTAIRSIDPDDLKRIQEEMTGRMDLTPQPLHTRTNKNTGLRGTPNTATAPAVPNGPPLPPHPPRPPRSRSIVTIDPNGPVNAQPTNVPQMPNYVFLSTQEWADKEKLDAIYDPQWFCIVEDGGAGTCLYFNRGHEIYVGQRTHYTSPTGYYKEINNLAKLKRTKLADIEEVIEGVYATLGVGTVFYAQRISKRATGRVDHGKFKVLVEPERMELALGSFVNVDYAIKYRLSRL